MAGDFVLALPFMCILCVDNLFVGNVLHTSGTHTHTHIDLIILAFFFSQHVEPEDIEGDLSHSRTHRCATITANSFRQ